METRYKFIALPLSEQELKRMCAAHWKPEISQWRRRMRRRKPARNNWEDWMLAERGEDDAWETGRVSSACPGVVVKEVSDEI